MYRSAADGAVVSGLSDDDDDGGRVGAGNPKREADLYSCTLNQRSPSTPCIIL